MTIRAVCVLRVLVMLWTGWFLGAYAVRSAVARQAELTYTARNQQARIG